MNFYVDLFYAEVQRINQEGIIGRHSFAYISIIMHDLYVFYSFGPSVPLFLKTYLLDRVKILHEPLLC